MSIFFSKNKSIFLKIHFSHDGRSGSKAEKIASCASRLRKNGQKFTLIDVAQRHGVAPCACVNTGKKRGVGQTDGHFAFYEKMCKKIACVCNFFAHDRQSCRFAGSAEGAIFPF